MGGNFPYEQDPTDTVIEQRVLDINFKPVPISVYLEGGEDSFKLLVPERHLGAKNHSSQGQGLTLVQKRYSTTK